MRALLLIPVLLLLYSTASAQMKVTEEKPRNWIGPLPMEPEIKTVKQSPGLMPVGSLAEVGITNVFKIAKVDEFINGAIAQGAFPGCRVLAAKNGKVFYDKSFGYLTYGHTQPVTLSTVYDLASLTKVTSTTLAVMRLWENGKLSIDKTVGDYLPFTIGSDKAPLLVRDLLLHQAGLKAFIPFYKSFLDSTGHLMDTVFHTKKDKRYNLAVAKDVWMRADYRDTVWKRILDSPLETKGRYVYSDLDYYFLAAIVEKITGKPIDKYVADQFYTPMGLKTMGYNPLGFVKPDIIAPTEDDQTFRRQVLQGYVHDPGAALFGGVGGHAGVFASAGEVAALFQMLLNEGTFKGKQYFKKETVEKFTAYGSSVSRRALGFDKPEGKAYDAGPTATRCSGYTYGHQGFTGTCAWADPATGVVFVFLSNRVYPNAENGAINKLGVRTVVQDYLYDALEIKDDTGRGELKKYQLGSGKYRP